MLFVFVIVIAAPSCVKTEPQLYNSQFFIQTEKRNRHEKQLQDLSLQLTL
jgi:hypothetical protein